MRTVSPACSGSPGISDGGNATPTTDWPAGGMTDRVTDSAVTRLPAAMSIAARWPTRSGRLSPATVRRPGSTPTWTVIRSAWSIVSPRAMVARTATTSWVLLVEVHAHTPSSAPRQTAATDATTRIGRRRSFGAGATSVVPGGAGRARPFCRPASVLSGCPVVTVIRVPLSSCYRLMTWLSPMVMFVVRDRSSGMTPLSPTPAQVTLQ